MSSRPFEVAKSLDVDKEDLVEIKKAKRADLVGRIAKLSLPVVSLFAGFVAGRAVSEADNLAPVGYPFISPVLLSVAVLRGRTSSWLASIAVSIVAFLVTFTIVVAAHHDSYGMTPKYSTYSR